MLSCVLDDLNCVREITITANKNCDIVAILKRGSHHVGSKPHVNALFDSCTTRSLSEYRLTAML